MEVGNFHTQIFPISMTYTVQKRRANDSDQEKVCELVKQLTEMTDFKM